MVTNGVERSDALCAKPVETGVVKKVPELEEACAAANVGTALREGVLAVVGVDSAVKWENDAGTAFGQLRRACVQLAQAASRSSGSIGEANALRLQAVHAPKVLRFLVDFAKGHKIRIRQVREVVGYLMESPSWAAAFQALPLLKERVCQELGAEMQAAFRISPCQNVVKEVSEKAEEKGCTMVEHATQDSLDPRSPDITTPCHATPSEKDLEALDPMGPSITDSSLKNIEASDATSGITSPCPVSHSWSECCSLQALTPRSARTPPSDWLEAIDVDGRAYYWNTSTRETRWERPLLFSQAPPPPLAAPPGSVMPGGLVLPSTGNPSGPTSRVDGAPRSSSAQPSRRRTLATAMIRGFSSRRGGNVRQGYGANGRTATLAADLTGDKRAAGAEDVDRSKSITTGDPALISKFISVPKGGEWWVIPSSGRPLSARYS